MALNTLYFYHSLISCAQLPVDFQIIAFMNTEPMLLSMALDQNTYRGDSTTPQMILSWLRRE